MKKIKIIAISILFFIVLFSVTMIILVRTFDINRFRPQITHYISEKIGANVKIKSISLNFSFDSGLDLNVKGVSVSDHPSFSSQNIFEVASTKLDIDIFKFVLQQNILVTPKT